MCHFLCTFFASNIQKYNSNPHPLAVTTVLINYRHFPQIINEIGAQKSSHSPTSCKQILICCLFYPTERSLCTHNWVATSYRFELLVKKGLFSPICAQYGKDQSATGWALPQDSSESSPSLEWARTRQHVLLHTWRPSLLLLNKQQRGSLLAACRTALPTATG